MKKKYIRSEIKGRWIKTTEAVPDSTRTVFVVNEAGEIGLGFMIDIYPDNSQGAEDWHDRGSLKSIRVMQWCELGEAIPEVTRCS